MAAKMRDVIRAIVVKEIERLRPSPAYATVVSIDRVLRLCEVRFPEDDSTTSLVVGMGSIQPSAVGQIVRVAGVVGDRYIDDVMGEPYAY